MNRKDFIKNGSASFISFTSLVTLLNACKKQNLTSSSSTSSGSNSETTNTGSCDSTPSETAGPFPTHTPSSLTMNDIKGDRLGVPLNIQLNITNKSNGCAALSGVTVDIWHCDKDGYYSEYGGSGMQSANFTSYHFLRGRQVTDSNGKVSFSSIFPGWYSGRAPHIHVHIYDQSGNSLLVTQVAFPADICNTVYTTAIQYYTRGVQDTSNTQDNVFSDSLAYEIAVLSGNIES